MNHKAYRDAFKKMKPPKIPFMPLLLKGNLRQDILERARWVWVLGTGKEGEDLKLKQTKLMLFTTFADMPLI